jgi:hypothetical protein
LTGWRRLGGGGEGRGKELMRRGRKSMWKREQWIVAQEKEESEGDENRDEEIVMVKLIVYKEKMKTGIKMDLKNP